MDIELIVLAYNQEGKASEVLQAMKQLQQDGIISILNAAVLVKNKDGKTSLTETEDVDAKHGALFGAITGGLVGLLGGPSGVIVGAAAGAATGGVTARVTDMGFPDEYLRDLQQGLRPGSSAIVALVEDYWVERLAEAVEEYGGQLFQQVLKAEIAAQLAAADGTAGSVKDPTAQDRLESRLKELQAQIAELKAQAVKAGADAKANLDKQIADLRARLEVTWDELRAQLDAQYQAWGAEIAELETQAAKAGAQAKADYGQRIAALRAKWDATQDKLRAQLEAELQGLEADIKELEAQAAKAGAETKAELDKRIAALRVKHEATQDKLRAQRKAQVEVWQAEVEALKVKATANRAKFAADYYKQLEAELEGVEADLKELKAQAATAGAEATAEYNKRAAALSAKQAAAREKLQTIK